MNIFEELFWQGMLLVACSPIFLLIFLLLGDLVLQAVEIITHGRQLHGGKPDAGSTILPPEYYEVPTWIAGRKK